MLERQTNSLTDPLGRYYTNSLVGSLLVNSMDAQNPELILDLGAGDGALINAAAQRWEKSNYLTVDIDQNAESSFLPKKYGAAFKHFHLDALNENLAAELDLEWGQIDIAVCNPPYIRPPWKKQFSEILEDAGLSNVLTKINEIPADMLFVAQNLRMLKDGGKLGLILPDGLISGERFKRFRAELISKHSIEKVIELPRKIFRNTDAKAHILVLKKNCRSENITVQKFCSNGILSDVHFVNADMAAKRLDYSYLISNNRSNKKHQLTIGDVTEVLRRGQYSSSEIDKLNFPVFHTTEFDSKSKYIDSSFNLEGKQSIPYKIVKAIAGDILIARVGRNLSTKVRMVKSGSVAISDCILLLRVKEKYRDEIYSFLKSKNGEIALEALSHGVGAKFITPKSLAELLF